MRNFLFILIALFSAPSIQVFGATVPSSPEQDTLRTSKRLRSIPNSEWQTIAGERSKEMYEVIKGDTLWMVSGRLFGDSKYWPKIWSINNGSITNPHLIRPGKKVVFLGGTDTTLPSVSVEGATATDAVTPPLLGENGETQEGSSTPTDPAHLKRSGEWRNLPQQDWEYASRDVITKDKELTVEEGAIKTLIDHANEPQRISLNSVLTTAPLVPWGEVVSARNESNALSVGDVVFIKSIYDLQVGRLYTIVGEQKKIRSPYTDRSAYYSPKLATVKIIGIRDRIFVASITESWDGVPRKSKLIEYAEPTALPKMIPGTAQMEALVLADPGHSSRMIAPNQQYLIDRGTSDGIQPGMVFRSFQHKDPGNGQKITESNFLVDADFLVVKTMETYSISICLNGRAQIADRILTSLLLDISDAGTEQDVVRAGGKKEFLGEGAAFKDLEKINEIEGIGEEEEKELKQIESLPSGGTTPPIGLPKPPTENGIPGSSPGDSTNQNMNIQVPDEPLEEEDLPPPPGFDPELDHPPTGSSAPSKTPPPKWDGEIPAPPTDEEAIKLDPPAPLDSAPSGISVPGSESSGNGDELSLPPPPPPVKKQ